MLSLFSKETKCRKALAELCKAHADGCDTETLINSVNKLLAALMRLEEKTPKEQAQCKEELLAAFVREDCLLKLLAVVQDTSALNERDVEPRLRVCSCLHRILYCSAEVCDAAILFEEHFELPQSASNSFLSRRSSPSPRVAEDVERVAVPAPALIESLKGDGGRRVRAMLALLGDVRFVQCGATMATQLARSPLLTQIALDAGAVRQLYSYCKDVRFEVAAESFGALKALLFTSEQVGAAWVQADAERFFREYHENLLGPQDEYLTKRHALKLLSDILLHRAFLPAMLKYVETHSFLILMMQLLKDRNDTFKFEAFHVFKLFAACPKKSPKVLHILVKNKAKLFNILDNFLEGKHSDEAFMNDRAAVVEALRALEDPRLERASSGENRLSESGPAR